MDFFSKNIKEINNENRQYAQKRKIVSELIRSGEPMTIPGLCITLKTSIPKGTKLVNELIEEGILVEFGKKETENGRRPVLYKAQPEFAFFIGVVIQLKGISMSVFNMDMQEVFQLEKTDFILDNTEKCLNLVIDFIREGLSAFEIAKEKLLGIGIGITGRVDSMKGDSYTYFNFLDIPLSKHLGNELLTRVYIDNDTHVIGLAEKVFGEAKKSKNALVVNLSRGLGMSIEANGEIISGSSGFAGEFGHMQFPDSENKLCLCGKRGCLGTEVSGYALEESFREKIQSGESSLILTSGGAGSIQYERILEAAVHGDLLSISLIHDMGFKLGRALGNIVNLLNPEQIIISGKFTLAKGIIMEAIKSGMVHTTLAQPFRSCTLSVSSIGPKGGVKGAGVLVLRRLGII